MRHTLTLLLLAAGLGACREAPAPAPPSPVAPAAAPAVPASPAAAPAAPPPSGPSSAVAAATSVPEAFRGEWDRSTADCGQPGSEARLRIEAGSVRFHESSGPVRSVERHGEREITVQVEAAGEGQVRTLARRWRLSAAGDTLQDVTQGDGLVRQRCPPARQ